MLLCSNNAFRCLGIVLLTAHPLTARLVSLCAENNQGKKVVVLHSYHHALPRVDDIDKAIASTLKKDAPIIETHIEYMDSSGYDENNLFNLLKRHIQAIRFLKRVELWHKQEEKWLNRKKIHFNIT